MRVDIGNGSQGSSARKPMPLLLITNELACTQRRVDLLQITSTFDILVRQDPRITGRQINGYNPVIDERQNKARLTGGVGVLNKANCTRGARNTQQNTLIVPRLPEYWLIVYSGVIERDAAAIWRDNPLWNRYVTRTVDFEFFTQAALMHNVVAIGCGTTGLDGFQLQFIEGQACGQCPGLITFATGQR